MARNCGGSCGAGLSALTAGGRSRSQGGRYACDAFHLRASGCGRPEGPGGMGGAGCAAGTKDRSRKFGKNLSRISE